MPKYRFLSDEELIPLEEELKQFLIVNGVQHEQWLVINKNNPELALDLIGIFSDQILETVYNKINYLEKIADDSYSIFNFSNENAELIVFKIPGIHLQASEHINTFIIEHITQLEAFRSSKHIADKANEIHQLIQHQAYVVQQEQWDFVSSIIY